MALKLHATTFDQADVVLTIDPAVEAAWSKAERGRYLHFGEVPPAGIPRDATLFRIRPMRWAERRAARDATASGHYSARGVELFERYVKAMQDAGEDAAAAGDAFRRALDLADRAELDRAGIVQLHHDEAVCASCVVEVIESNKREPWSAVLDALAGGTASQAIAELARHINRISRVSAAQAF